MDSVLGTVLALSLAIVGAVVGCAVSTVVASFLLSERVRKQRMVPNWGGVLFLIACAAGTTCGACAGVWYGWNRVCCDSEVIPSEWRVPCCFARERSLT